MSYADKLKAKAWTYVEMHRGWWTVRYRERTGDGEIKLRRQRLAADTKADAVVEALTVLSNVNIARGTSNPSLVLTERRAQVFWSNVVKSDQCWRWAGVLGSDGYGCFYCNGANRVVHRVAYVLQNGAIPDGLTIDHLCRNRLCVRGSHLEAVTRRENTLRGIGPSAQNQNKTHCPKGHEYDSLAKRTDGRMYRACSICTRSHKEEREQCSTPQPPAREKV